ncbi:hypothetical protein [Pyrococcus kukulkanii]|uniref:hypothetical protein n=1 Tax=Pyrococcus kukulkanii TaxID=1609559 RepID=UPI0035686632
MNQPLLNLAGNIYVAGAIAVVKNNVVLLALKYEEEIFEFLRALLREDWDLLSVLEKTKPKTIVKPKEREKEIKLHLAIALSKEFDYVLVDVKLNAPKGEEWDPFIRFSPDADIIAVSESENRIIGIEVKGYRSNRGFIQKANIYEAIGEAMIYLINPQISYRGKRIEGSIFDEVWLCYLYKGDFEYFKKSWKLRQLACCVLMEELLKGRREIHSLMKRPRKYF